MYNTHPTIIDQNSRFYNESAKLACIFNDISVKQESIITQSAPEQVIWVWEIASEGARWEFGLLSNMPTPEHAYEPRVGLAVHLAIFNRGCEPEGVFIDLIIHLKNAPSSEPDAGERHVPYTVFKPIKDGINNWVKGVENELTNTFHDWEDTGKITNGNVDKIGKAFFGPFWDIIKILLEIMKCVITIIKPFLDLVKDLLQSVKDFMSNIVKSAIGANGDGTDYSDSFSTDMNNEFSLILEICLGIAGFEIEESTSKVVTADSIANSISFVALLVTLFSVVFFALTEVVYASVIIAILGWFLWGFSSYAAKSIDSKFILGLVSVVILGFAAILALIDMSKSGNPIGALVTFITFVLSAVAMCFAIGGLVSLNKQKYEIEQKEKEEQGS